MSLPRGIGGAPRVHCNGAAIPAIGFGTWELSGAACQRAVEDALELGYRHLDTAAMYGNEAQVGAAIRASGVPRAEIFLTTKVWRDDIGAGALERSAAQSVVRLGGPVDLLLVHWPNASIPLEETISALCAAKRLGSTRHIGVSNFSAALLHKADEFAARHGQRLATNQCEYHPGLRQDDLLAACRARGVSFTSYSPLGKAALLGHPALLEIARRHGRTAAQIVLRWHVQQPAVIAIPKASRREHARQNLAVFDFSLGDADMKAIAALAQKRGRITDPSFAPEWD
ncbi:MAG: 2,5-didehydrogluconate reductase [Hyphomicrobiales bacterium]|nr:2,5-didehydrogluconate reductase [Hyphomicrobiales bacterium]